MSHSSGPVHAPSKSIHRSPAGVTSTLRSCASPCSGRDTTGRRRTSPRSGGWLGVRVVVQLLPQRHGEAGRVVVYRTDAAHGRGDRGPSAREERSDRMFGCQPRCAVLVRADLGDDGVRPKPHHGVVRLLEDAWALHLVPRVCAGADGRAHGARGTIGGRHGRRPRTYRSAVVISTFSFGRPVRARDGGHA